VCVFNASLGCTAPQITAACKPLTFTGQMQVLAAFADDNRLYEHGLLHASNAQVRGCVAVEHVARHTSHVARHTLHVTRHTSHVTRHTSHVHLLQLAAIASAMQRCAGNDFTLPLLLLFACAPAGA
jgi:hypothetical protein